MKSENGQSLVEFALILPLLVILLFGIVDFGRAFHAYLTIDHAGREVARLMSIGGNETDIDNKISSTTGSLDTSNNKLTINFPNGKTGLASGAEARVVIKYTFHLITPVLGSLVKTIPLEDETFMRVE